MRSERWWLGSAILVAALMAALATGNLIEDDGGPLLGKVLFAAILYGGTALVGGGLVVRRSNTRSGNRLVAIGVMPGSLGIALFWFPPAVAVGILAVITAVYGFKSKQEVAAGVQYAFYGVTLAAVVLAIGTA